MRSVTESSSSPPIPQEPAAEEKPTSGVTLRYTLGCDRQRGAALSNPLFELLAAVLESGSIHHAAKALGTSYRYVWGSLRKWETSLGEPLIVWSQGRPARPTQFAERLLWAERRARTRMQPHIEALRSGLARVLAEARDPRHQLLSMRASHDIALPLLQQHAASIADLHLDLGFQGSVEALRALSDRQCLIAGFHVPALQAAAPIFSKALKPLLRPQSHALIGCSRRMQGLMMRKEHAGRLRSLEDVARERLRFVNRQPGSGTRMLVEHLMREQSIAPEGLAGASEHTEHTHVAVALCIASGVADVGVGVEAAALEFGLHFVPVVEEDYFLACLKDNVGHAGIERLCTVLAGERWRDILVRLPGYRPAAAPGRLLVIEAALPWWQRRGAN